MEKLPENPILKFHPDTLEHVRKQLGLDQPGMIDQSIDLLDLWLVKQQHFVKKDFSREFKERLLVNCKGSVERAKEKLDKMCTIRTLLPHFFETYDIKADLEPYNGGLTQVILPSMTPNYERVYFVKNIGFKTSAMIGSYRSFIKILEYVKTNDYMTGLHMVVDVTEANIVEFATKMNPIDLQHCVSILVDVLSMRLKSVRFITPSKLVDILVSLVKQAMSAKLAARVHVHQNIEEMYTSIPKELMPKDYGGQAESLKELSDKLNDAVSSEEFVNHMKEMSKAVTNEDLRPKDSYNEQYMGMPGSFRTLTVD